MRLEKRRALRRVVGTTEEVRVLVADRQPLVRAGLREILERRPGFQVCAEVDTGAGLRSTARSASPSVVVVDIDLACPHHDLLPDLPAPVLLLGDRQDDERIAPLLSTRVRGFVARASSAADIVAAVSAVALGHAWLPHEVAGRLLDLVGGDRCPGSGTTGFEHLTRREREVLQLMAEGKSTAAIAGELVVQISTIKSHIYHLMQKLGVGDRTQAVALAYRSGIVRRQVPGPIRWPPGADAPVPTAVGASRWSSG